MLAVVNCFQKCIFDLLETTNKKKLTNHDWVVNCFQKCIFDLLETTVKIFYTYNHLLWIAFKNVSLTYWKQRCAWEKTRPRCCELLSKMYLWPIGNNRLDKHSFNTTVVNCFQKCIFDLLETTLVITILFTSRLWIAFKNVSLTYWKQRITPDLLRVNGCELLSKMYLWPIGNNLLL